MRTLRAALKRNRDLLVASLRARQGKYARFVPALGELYLWLLLEGRLDTEAAAMTQAAGVVVTARCRAFPAEPSGDFLRLSYAMPESDWVDAAARTVAKAVLFGLW